MEATESLTPEVATQQRADLMANPEFRAQAAAGGAAWERLSMLNRSIADAQPATEAQHQVPTMAAQEDPEPPPGAFDPPERPEGYQLPTQEAQRLGLHVDLQADIDLRTALHQAGVDQTLASMLYWSAAHALTEDMTPVSVQDQYLKAEAALRQRWGDETEARVKAANEEGRRLFEALPESVTQGMSYREFALVTGLANNRVAVEQLYMRAKARTGAL